MRINKFIASSTGISRRAADAAIAADRVAFNGDRVEAGQQVGPTDRVTLDGKLLEAPAAPQTILFNKPVGYVVSRDGQGSQTIYNLLPTTLHHLKPIGRLDKDSSGLLVLTNDGDLAQQLTHPRFQKTKLYEIRLDKPLLPEDQKTITSKGVILDDGVSKLQLKARGQEYTAWQITMTEGRNRQIRRTFEALGYEVIKLHRTQFGTYTLPDTLKPGENLPIAD